MIDRCGLSCKSYTELKKKNSMADGTCSYDGKDCPVRCGDKCIHGLEVYDQSPRLIAQGVPFSRISSLASLL